MEEGRAEKCSSENFGGTLKFVMEARTSSERAFGCRKNGLVGWQRLSITLTYPHEAPNAVFT